MGILERYQDDIEEEKPKPKKPKAKKSSVKAELFEEDKFFRKGFVPEWMIKELHSRGNNYLALGEVLFQYQDGVYVPCAEMLEKEVGQLLASRERTNYIDETHKALIRRYRTEPDTDLINFQDTLYHLETEKTEAHNPTLASINQFPVQFKPTYEDAATPAINLLSEWVDWSDVAALMQMIGSCFHAGSVNLQKAWILIGEGSNGKSILLDFIESLVGAENICSTSWVKFGESPFATFDMFQKAVAIDADFNVHSSFGSDIKAIIDGSAIQVEQKYKPSFRARMTCTMIAAMNELPRTKDTTRGFFRRFNIIRFPNTFKEDAAKAREIKKILSDEKLKTDFVQRCLKAYRAAWKLGNYTISEQSEIEKEEFRQTSNPVLIWIEECFEDVDDHKAPMVDVYDFYKIWCEQNGHKPLSRSRLTRTLKAEGYEIKTATHNKTTERCLIGAQVYSR